jgi:hypothetical protein
MKLRLFNRILIIIFVTILVFMPFIERIFELPSVSESLNGKLSQSETKSIEILVELTKSFITFAVAVIGGLFYIVVDRYKASPAFKKIEIVLIVACSLSSIISIYCGQIIFSKLVLMLANDFLELLDDAIIWPMRLQFWFLVAAISFGILLMFQRFVTFDD